MPDHTISRITRDDEEYVVCSCQQAWLLDGVKAADIPHGDPRILSMVRLNHFVTAEWE